MGVINIVMDIKKILLPIEHVYFKQLDLRLIESGVNLKKYDAEIKTLKQKQENSMVEAFEKLCDQSETDLDVFRNIRKTFYFLEFDLKSEVDAFIHELKQSDLQSREE